jgi:hypothetical protein
LRPKTFALHLRRRRHETLTSADPGTPLPETTFASPDPHSRR